jgi:hypothetical protein
MYKNDYGWELKEYGIERETCPSIPTIPAGLSKEIILCFVIPKDHKENFYLTIYDSDKNYCGACEYCTCTSSSVSLMDPSFINYDDIVSENPVGKIDDITLMLNSAVLIKQEGFNVLEISFDATNVSNESVWYSATTTFAIDPDGMAYPYDNSISKYSNCNIQTSRSIDLTPGLTKSYTYCYEVPSDINTFDLSIRNMNVLSGCGTEWLQCKEYVLNISNPSMTSDEQTANEQALAAKEAAIAKAKELQEAAEQVLLEKINAEPIIEKSSELEYNRQNIASFVDTTKDPQHYIDRYNNEPTYKEWFDENYSQYSSIYEAVGLEEPLGIASFVDTTKDPQSYVNRYFNEPTYKEWFDDNYSQYSSIYEAVGLEEPVAVVGYTPEPEYIPEPTVEVADTSNCGAGTESVNGICKVIQTQETSEGGGCLIATATYGSEMATEVQQLRELRDNQLLNTESGSMFMGTFNDIYYSFSPVIADYERENPLFKEAVKLAITPLISSLSLMENAESESEVLSIGISLILLNLGMYLGVPAVVVIGIRKIK